MVNKTFVRVSGWLFLLSGILFVGASVFTGDRPLYAWLGLSATVLLAMSMWGIYDFMRGKANHAALKLGIGAMLTGVIFLVGIYATAYISEAADQAAGATAPILDTFDDLFMALNVVVILIGALLTYGIAPALIAYSGLKTATVPRWLSWMGIVGGVYSLLWAGWGWVFGPDNIIIFLPGVVLIYLWQVILGVVMARYQVPVQQAAAQN
jgi:hypothetical protein